MLATMAIATSSRVGSTAARAASKESYLPRDTIHMITDAASKKVVDAMPAPRRHWVGDGFHVYSVFDQMSFTKEASPFLMFDYAAPQHFKPTRQRRGVGAHPHKGIETVTLAFQGSVEHADSTGGHGIINPGDVQWMTAGRGIVHEEYHAEEFGRAGGTLEMCQLWVNLPAEAKKSKAKYQNIRGEDIPSVPLSAVGATADGTEDTCVGRARIIAGTLNGVTGPAQTFTAVNLWDVRVDTPDVPVELSIPQGHNTLVFVRRGALRVLGSTVGPQGMVRLSLEGSRVQLTAMEAGTEVLVLGGEIIDEPIAHRGPFVMNSPAELQQAEEDFRRLRGAFGR